MGFKKICLVIYSVFICLSSFCQFQPLVKNILLADSFNTENPREKIFIHYDKPYYYVNDTVWLKGYIVSASDYAAFDSSKIAYIEIINPAGESIKRISAYCSFGIFYSNISLNKTDFTPGAYVLRAFTNHMRNYGDSVFFESRFTIIDPAAREWDLSVRNLSLSNNRLVVKAALQSPGVPPRIVSVILRTGKKTVFKQNILIAENGNISIDTLLNKDADSKLQLEISDKDAVIAQLPLRANEDQQTDLQFLPEGGSFIVNKRQQLGFKAIDIFGKGKDVKGRIEDSKKQSVTTFSSIHNGMGTVWLTPEANETYTAVLDNGQTYRLAPPQPSGTHLQITNQPDSDSIEVMVEATPDLNNHRYFFRASAKGISCAMGPIRIKDKPSRLAISKKAFPSGICRFTLYDSNYLPVNERVIMIWHHDMLKLKLDAQKMFFDNRDSVHILLTTQNSQNMPVRGSFSAAVIDSGKLGYPKYAENIISYLLLSSDLRGDIEEPSYYFDAPLPGATDALMLTQGWVHYDHFYSTPAFEYEKSFSINGRVSNLLNKGVTKSNVTLFGKDGRAKIFLSDTVTDQHGNFRFDNFPDFFTDSVNMVIRALNKRQKSFGIGVEINEPVFPAYHAEAPPLFRENILYDTVIRHHVQEQVKQYNKLRREKGYLEEVIVTSRTKVQGSKNLNEDGGADQVITKNTLEKTPKESLLDVLKKEIPGFYKGTLSRSPLQVYKVNADLGIFIIDGYNISKYYEPVSSDSHAFSEYLENYLKYITAEEVVGIEVMKTTKNTFAYERYFNMHSNAMISYVFIEITTHSGNGAFNKRVPGMYLYRPVAPVIARTFYSPRYSTTRDDTNLPDYRSTLYWKPDIITDEKGEAEFSFYTSDSNGPYLVIVQGTDMNGRLGVGYLPLIIKKEDKSILK